MKYTYITLLLTLMTACFCMEERTVINIKYDICTIGIQNGNEVLYAVLSVDKDNNIIANYRTDIDKKPGKLETMKLFENYSRKPDGKGGFIVEDMGSSLNIKGKSINVEWSMGGKQNGYLYFPKDYEIIVQDRDFLFPK